MGRRDDEDEERGSRRGGRDEERGSSRRDRDDDRGSSRRREDDDDRGSRRGRDDDDGDRRGGGGGSYRYERRDDSKTKERANRGGTDYDRFLKDGLKMFKPNDGDNRIRIMPPTWGPKTKSKVDEKPDHYGYDIYVHYGVGADRQSYLCLAKHLGKPDPIAEAREEVKRELNENEGDKELEQMVKDLEAKRRVLVFLVDRDNEKEGVQAWAMPWTLDRDIVQVMQDKSTGEVLPIDDPEEGYDVEFTKKGSKNRTEYTGVAIARRSSPLGRKGEEWMEFCVDHPLPDQLVFFDYDHIAKAFGGKATKRRDDDDGDDRRGSRDRDDRDGRSRDRDRDDDRRGGSARDRRSRDEEEERPARDRRGRDEEEERPARGRGGRDREEAVYDWDRIHDMTKSELEDLIEQKDLDIKPKDAKDVEDLADWVCEEMKIKKEKKEERRSRDDDDEGADKLRKMRERRERD